MQWLTKCCSVDQHRLKPIHLPAALLTPLLQLYSALQREVQSDAFTDALARSQHELQQHPQVPGAQAAQGGGCEVLAQDWWELKEDGELRGMVANAEGTQRFQLAQVPS